MATPLIPCLDCGRLSKRSRCPKHERAKQKRHNDARSYYKSGHWQKLRDLALVKFLGACAVCESKDRVNVHHLSARPKGVAEPTYHDVLSNLICLCQRCHNDYEDDLRQGRATSLKIIVEAMR